MAPSPALFELRPRCSLASACVVLLPLFFADAAAAPPREVRALWVTRWDYRTPDDVRAIVRNAAQTGFNRLFFQVRGEATCFFPSSVEPWAWELSGDISQTGRDPGWDPLALAIDLAHGSGLELHAYLNVLPAWKKEIPPPKSSSHVFVTHPEWIMVDSQGHAMSPERHKFYAFLNPALPEVRTYLVRVFGDVARRYPQLDGIHLDYVRYPGEIGDFSHDPFSLGEFREASGGKTPAQAPEQWQAWRCGQVSRLVAELTRAIRQANPDVEISASVAANTEHAVTRCGQRSLDWPDRGLVDAIVPMAYHHDFDRYTAYLDSFLGGSRPRRGMVIVGVYPNEAWESLGYDLAMMERQIQLARQMRADGVAMFAYSRFFPNHKPGEWARHLTRRCGFAP
jgi:uncharacterized lipoprotein YddW (UPF0748 family)